MKPLVIIPTIVGSTLLLAGGAIFAVGLSSCSKKDTLTHEFALEGDINSINFDVDVSDVKFNATTDGTKKVVFKETEKMYHTYSVTEGKLKIGFEDTRKWNEKMFNTTDFKVELYIPGGHYTELTVKDDTGSFDIPGEFSFDKLSIEASTGDMSLKCGASESFYFKTSTGNVSISSSTAKNMTLTSSTGNLNMNDVKVEEKITISKSTGHIDMSKVHAKDYESSSSTGHVNLKDVIVENHIKIKTSTGDVKLEDSDAATLNITTSTGDVKGTLLTNKIFYVHTDTGKVNVPTSTEGGLCEITTDTGDVSISIKG